ncbi:MAG: HipA N-terminal domain-containing protein [Saprospiraceae bacterium]
MRSASIKYKGESAGILTQHDDGSFTFKYEASWVNNQNKPAISLTLPKTKEEYHSAFLFPFFYNKLPEGSNKQVVCRFLQIDEDDSFSLLTNTARYDTIGAVTVETIGNGQ